MNEKLKKFLKVLLKIFIVIAILVIIWIAFSLIGRKDAASVIPDTAVIRITVPNPARLLDSILTHESLDDISTVPELASMASDITALKENDLLKNRFLRLALRGKLELALLSTGEDENKDGTFAAAYDLKLLSPLLRLIPIASNFVTIPNLYFVQAGKNSRFEYRVSKDNTIYIGTYKNILFVTDSSSVFESRLAAANEILVFKNIKISEYDAGVRLSHQYINEIFGNMDESIAAILDNLEFDSTVEAGLSIHPRKIDFHLSAPISTNQPSLSRLVQSRSQASDINERLPGSTQYATILSAGTLEELFQASAVFKPEMDDTLRLSSTASRLGFGLSLEELLFSWSGREFAAFGIEGRPHPVYAIQVADEKKRQQVFDKAFKSIVLNEDARLSLDGTRIPRIEIPGFLQSILSRWNINLPAPYYMVYKDYLLLCESADTLLSALRAMQRNDVLPKTQLWRNIAGGKSSSRGSDAAAFSIYYSLDRSMPFFLRNNTAFSNYLSLYRQGLVRLSFNKGVVDISFSLIPGSGHGVSLVSGYPLDLGVTPHNQLFGAGSGNSARLFYVSGSSAYSMNINDTNIINVISGIGKHWIIPGNNNAWVVSDRGRVTLVDGDMEPQDNFPVLTGLRMSAAPAAFEDRIYLCDEDGNVAVVDDKGNQNYWKTKFDDPLISPPSFLTVPAKGKTPAKSYAAVYPKSFFGEIYLLDLEGNILPNWPAPISKGSNDEDDNSFSLSAGLGFGSPLVFAHENRVLVAFVCQTGELTVYDEEAKPVTPFPLFLNNMFYYQPVFDGTYLWLIAADGTLFKVSVNGEIFYHHIPDLYVKEEGYITVFDCDNDKVPEIFITGEGNAMYAYTRNFRSLEGFPLPVWGKPYFYDNGKKAEVFGIGMDRKLYRWQFR